MDLSQRKLNKTEWNSIEVPVSTDEKCILDIIKQGYHNIDIKVNSGISLLSYLKISHNSSNISKIEEYLFNKYFKNQVELIENKIQKLESYLQLSVKYSKQNLSGIVRLNSADKVRLDNCANISENKVFEFILLKYAYNTLCYCDSHDKVKTAYNYYTLFKLLQATVPNLNSFVNLICQQIVDIFDEVIDKKIIIENAVSIIETNKNLLKYNDIKLYEHQKKIFMACKNPQPKLILYIAPTGTGKTITPIGLSEDNRIIFVCAARHVGLALARSAISIGKKVAFAFGCNSADDIRLHYFAAKEFTKNKKSGGIGKVDNSVGDNVEIMICDIVSYIPAMYYMLAFNHKSNIIMYWDEPTITMDYEDHDFHNIINNNWKENIIPNIVLSSATLPKLEEIPFVIHDFKNKIILVNEESDSEQDEEDDKDESEIDKFNPSCEPLIENILSHDCIKSIPIINSAGYVVLPHYLEDDYEKVKQIASFCESNKTLLRYFDLKEVVNFILYVNNNNFTQSKFKIDRIFHSMDSINMVSIKEYYLKLLQNIISGTWGSISLNMKLSRQPKLVQNNFVDSKGNRIFQKINSVDTSKNLNNPVSLPIPDNSVGIYISTKDAFSLTDGPTIYICENVQKIATFCIQQANIPAEMMTKIMTKIEFNNTINSKIQIIEDELDSKEEKVEKFNNPDNKNIKKDDKKQTKKINKNLNLDDGKSYISKLTNELTNLRALIKSAVLNDTFVPNSPSHIEKWSKQMDTSHSFTSSIEEHIVSDIMSIHGIEDSWKVLLLMGIGVFANHKSIQYTEIMKKLADEQKLFIIIASSDYIYGTNYQFCHAYLGKDLNLTQEKIIQAMGRVGRNNIQQSYSIRFRDNNQILKLFSQNVDKPEVTNMNKLFNSFV